LARYSKRRKREGDEEQSIGKGKKRRAFPSAWKRGGEQESLFTPLPIGENKKTKVPPLRGGRGIGKDYLRPGGKETKMQSYEAGYLRS